MSIDQGLSNTMQLALPQSHAPKDHAAKDNERNISCGMKVLRHASPTRFSDSHAEVDLLHSFLLDAPTRGSLADPDSSSHRDTIFMHTNMPAGLGPTPAALEQLPAHDLPPKPSTPPAPVTEPSPAELDPAAAAAQGEGQRLLAAAPAGLAG